MSASQTLTGLLRRDLLPALLYRISQLVITQKIRSNGRIIAAIYDLCAAIIALILAYWIVMTAMADLTIASYSLEHHSTNIDKIATTFSLVLLYWKAILANL